MVRTLEDRIEEFIASYSYVPVPPRPNTLVRFLIFDETKAPITNSPSPLNILAWKALLHHYLGDLPKILAKILEYSALLGYNGPEHRYLVSKNHSTAYISPNAIDSKLQSDLACNRVLKFEHPGERLTSSPLGLVPKKDRGFRRIHDLSYPRKSFINSFIDESYPAIHYPSIEDILHKIVKAGRHCIILKRDIKDAFRNIPIAPHQRWLLGF